MVTSNECLKKWGHPVIQADYLILWEPPTKKGKIPKRVYCNQLMVQPLSIAFANLVNSGYWKELQTWDGCFNIRPMVGGSGNYSLHSWGIAVDVNAQTNGYGQKPTLSPGFVKCFTDAGFDWGGNFQRPDGMHFQLKKI